MIGFIGLSHLGLNYSLATAAKDFDVVAFDPDAKLVADLNRGLFPIEEPGFKETLATCRQRMRYTADPTALRRCGLVFYALDVRTNERNESDTGPLADLIYQTIGGLVPGTIVVLLSQVKPGFTRQLTSDLEQRSVIAPSHFFYQVETLIFGAAVQRALEPERYMIGAAAPEEPLPACYREWLDAFKCPALVMRYESAELAKIAINFFLVSSVSTTNTLAEVCEAIGADWGEIAPALRLDKRIGPHAYLKPGLGIAGGNLERDLVTIQGIAAAHGTDAGIVSAWQHNSAYRKAWALRAVQRELPDLANGPHLAVWGLAYKQDTHSLKNSASIELLRALPGAKIHVYDPAARIDPAAFPHVLVRRDPLDAVEGAAALVVMTPWTEFSIIPPAEIAAGLAGRLVIDPYGVLNHAACAAAGLRHLRLGSS